MKVYLHFQFLKTGWGGSNSFMSTLAGYLASRSDVELVRSIHQETDIFLLAGWSTGEKLTSLNRLRQVRQHGTATWWQRWLRPKTRPPKIVHRLDGIGYLYGRKDREGDNLQASINALSDHSIIQSRYSQQLFEKEGFKLSPESIISNGVNQDLFHMHGKTPWDLAKPLVLGSVSWSANPRKGHAAMTRYSLLPNVKVRFAGNWPKDMDPAKVERLPAVPFHSLGDFYRSCDAFLFPGEGESCPNVVLEAISCGLPVLYHPSGGTPEIAEEFGVPMNPASPEETIDRLRSSYSDIWKRLRDDPSRYAISRAGERYLEVFKSLL